jgi:hypothetical protein
MVDVEYVAHLPRAVTLEEIKQVPELREMVLLKRARLSVQPVTRGELETLVALGGGVLPSEGVSPGAAAPAVTAAKPVKKAAKAKTKAKATTTAAEPKPKPASARKASGR